MLRLRALLVLLLGLGAVVPLAALAPASSDAAAGDRVVVLVRHAETAPDGSSDPPLSAAGLQRAEALARIAASYDVEAAFATPFKRTLGTAGPAAVWLGLRPEAVPVTGTIPAHVADVAARVRRASGAAALVVGHSNTVPEVIFALTGQTVAPISESQYDRLFVVRLPAVGSPTVTESTY